MTDASTSAGLIQWTFNIGELLQTFVILGGGLIVLGQMKSTINDIQDEMKDMKKDLKTLNQLVSQIAVQDSRLDRIESDVRELRHGHGFVVGKPAE